MSRQEPGGAGHGHGAATESLHRVRQTRNSAAAHHRGGQDTEGETTRFQGD